MTEDQLKSLGAITGLEDEKILGFALAQAEKRLKAILNSKAEALERKPLPSIPQGLEFIVLEVAVKRIRRLGSEGLASEAVEGHSRVFQDSSNDFDEFMTDIDAFFEDGDLSGRRKGDIWIW